MRRPFLGCNIHALFHANSLAVSFFLRNKEECCHLVTPRYSTPVCSVLKSFFSAAPPSLIKQSQSINHSRHVPVVCMYVIQTRGGDDKKTITDCDQHKMAPRLALMLSRHSLTSPCCAPPSLIMQSVSVNQSLTPSTGSTYVCNSDKGDDKKKNHNRLRPAQNGASTGTDAVATQPNVAMLNQTKCRQWKLELLIKMQHRSIFASLK